MRNDGNLNLGGERVVITPGDSAADFLPQPGEHEARNLANVALNTEGFSPDEIVSVQGEDFENESIVEDLAKDNSVDEAAKNQESHGSEPDVVKIITTDRQVDKNREIKAAVDESEKFTSGKMTPAEFAQSIRGSLEDNLGEGKA